MRSRFVRACLILLAVLLIAGVLIVWSIQGRNRAVTDADQLWRPAQVDTRELLTSVVDQESGQRGFILTGIEDFLEPYSSGRERSRTLSKSLAESFADHSTESDLVRAVVVSLAAWQLVAEQEIAEARRDLDAARSLVATGDGRRLLDQFRADLDRLVVATDQGASESSRQRDRSFTAAVVASIVAGLALAIAALVILRRSRSWIDERQRLLDTERGLRVENRATAEALERAATLFRSVINTIPVGIAVFDPEMRFLHINEAFATLNGITIADHIGQTPHEVFPEQVADQMREMFEQAVAGDTVLERPMKGRPAGSDESADELLVCYFPTHDREGRLLAVGSSVVDTSEQSRTAAALRETAALLDTIIGESLIGFAYFDLNGRCQRINAALAEIDGVPLELTVGRTAEEVLPALAATITPILEQVVATREPVRDVELVAHIPATPGRIREWMAGFYPVQDSRGELIGVGVAALEITQLRRVERRLRSIITTLQESFLPAALPEHPEFELAVEYQAASDDTEIGGDFYDAALRPDGSISITIGDVCGHDIEAAVLTSVVRHTISAAAQHFADPGEVLRWANQAVHDHADDARFVTAAHATLHPADRDGRSTLHLALAGHPLPVLIPADGSRALEIGAAGTLLGVDANSRTWGQLIDLAVGDQVVFYTDGLSENSIPRLDPEGLLVLVGGSRADTAAGTARLLIERYGELSLRHNRDDVAVLVIRRKRSA